MGFDNGQGGLNGYSESSSSSTTTVTPAIPAPPKPSADPGIAIQNPFEEEQGEIPQGKDIDVFTLAPITALKMLCSSVEDLVLITGDVPPTPPVSHPATPTRSLTPGPQLEKKEDTALSPDASKKENFQPSPFNRKCSAVDADGVPVTKTPIGSPEAHPTEPLHATSDYPEPMAVQQLAITRKFYSKKAPPISLEEYLLRLHKYCPMSTGVYLATALYIHRLAITERIIPVTARNCHRLLLAGLRVAMKALEDLSYPHRRFSKVGGVTETELGRLEISFCFLTNFDLRVSREMLHDQAVIMKDGGAASFRFLPESFQPRLPVVGGKRRLPTTAQGIQAQVGVGS